MKKLLALALLGFIFYSCGGSDDDGGGSGGTDNDPKVPTEVVGNKVKVTPLKYDNPFRNPMMGWRDVFSVGLDPIPDNYPLPYGSVYKEYIPWDKIESVASDGVDKIVAYSNHRWKDIEKKNVKVIPRVYIHWLGTPPVSDPDRLDGIRFPSDIPYTMNSGDEYPLTGGYFHSTFQSRLAKLIEKMGEAWDNDPRVAYVEMGIIGQWGEQHSPMVSTNWPAHNGSPHVDNVTWIPGVEKTLGDAFTAAFKNKKVMVRYAYDFKSYNFGYYWDSWAVGEEDVRGYQAIKDMGDRWKTQVIGGEICWNWGDLSKFKSLSAMLNDKTARTKIIKQIRELHANHLGYFSYARPTVDFSQSDFGTNAQAVQKALGYRFVLSEFTYSKKIENNKSFDVTFKVTNEGSSPFYYNWPVEISLLKKDSRQKVWSKTFDNVNISEWMPGDNWDATKEKYAIAPRAYDVSQTFTLDQNIEAGEYIIAISVLDPAGNMPSLRFATANYYSGGRHPMGYVGVNKDITDYALKTNGFDNLYTDLSLSYKVGN